MIHTLPLARFITQLVVHWRDDGLLQLDAPLVYIDAKGTRWEVPAGFVTDLASVPRIVPGLIRLVFRGPLQTAWAAVLHDYLCESETVQRSLADAVFYEALRATGESRSGAFVMWASVRAKGLLNVATGR